MPYLLTRSADLSLRPITLTTSEIPRSVPIASLIQLETPHAVVDLSRVRANVTRVAQYARKHGITLRPHSKTHKDPEIARIQLDAGASGVTVATPLEAEVMSEATTNILVAYPPVDPRRVDRLLSLPEDVDLKIALDSVEAVERLEAALERKPRNVGVLVEMDLGGRRTGVSSDEELLRVAHACRASAHLEFMGLLVHPGHVRLPVIDPGNQETWTGSPETCLREALEKMSATLKATIATLAKAGFSCPIVSGGNTPSLFSSHLIPELTELRPGTYVYSDRDIASQGIFGWQDCAYSVLSTVVSVAVPGQAVIDAGTKAIAKESLAGLEGYGALLDRPEVVVKSMSEEHGILDLSRTNWRPKVGDRVRVVPNHVCVSVHLQDRIAFIETGDLTVRSVPARGR